MTIDLDAIAADQIAQSLLLAPGWARVALTAPDQRLREAAATELANTMIGAMAGKPAPCDARQLGLPL